MAELELEKLSIDVAAQEMLKKAQAEGVETIFDRAKTMKPCPIGAEGACCRICAQGPCRVPPPKKKEGESGEEKKQRMGLCGATAETIVARNFARMVAAGTAAHSDHSRGVAKLFKEIAHGEAPGYEIKDVAKLKRVAKDWGVAISVGEGEEAQGRDKLEIAKELADKILAEFGQQSGEINYVKRAPLKRQEIWRKNGVVPRGIDIEVVELMHRTHMGVDQDYHNLIKQSTRCALADGWAGSMISTDLQDIMFGCPVPIAGEINLGVLKEDHVNVVMHGHEPLLPEMLYVAAQDPELITYAQNKGAKGIQLAGMCCSANEVLMRHGVPVAGNYLHQELAVVTGAVDALVVDVQCEMQALENVAKCYHTKIVTTDDRAKMPLAEHIPFDEHHALDVAKKIIRLAIDNYPNRKAPVMIPSVSSPTVVGFCYETIQYLLGGSIRGLLLHPERQHHQRPGAGGGRGGGLQQLPHHPGQLPPDPDQGAVEERRHRALHRLRRHGCGQIRPADPGGGQQVLRPGSGGGLRDGGHPAGAAHGGLRGQLPHPDGGHRLRQGRRPGHRHQRPARRGRGPGVDEREGHRHRPVLRGLGGLHPLRGHLAHHRLASSSPTTCSRASKRSTAASGTS